jgi:phosphocarrier protein FPr
VPDPVFAGGMFGDGIGIDPLAAGSSRRARRRVASGAYRPCGDDHDAARRAVLLHIGIDTVELNGQGFTARVEDGAHVARATC